MSMCELVASQINTLRELGRCAHAPARRSPRWAPTQAGQTRGQGELDGQDLEQHRCDSRAPRYACAKLHFWALQGPCLPRSAEGPAEGLAPAQRLEPMKEGAHARDTLASDGSRTVPGAPVEPAEFTTLFLAHGLPARRPHCASPQKTVSPGRRSRSRRARPPVKLWPAI